MVTSLTNETCFYDFSNTAMTLYFHEYWIYSMNILFGLPSNSYVIWLIVTGTGNGLASEFFSLNLAVCEILLCLNSFFYLIQYTFQIPVLVWIILTGLTMTGRPLFQCLMCVERYLAVVHPVTFLKYKPLRYRVICCVVVWLLTLGDCVVIFVTWCLISDEFYFYYMWVQPVLFLSIQLFCLVAVLRALKQSGPGERKREREEENQMKRRAFYLILITTVAMAIMHGPYSILWVLNMVLKDSNGSLFAIAYAFYAMPGLVLPLLFLQRVGKLPFIKCK